MNPKQVLGRNATFGDERFVGGQMVLSENEEDPRDSDRGNSSEQEGGAGSGELSISTEQEMALLGGVDTYSKPRSRETDLSEQENEDGRSDRRNSSDQLGGPESGELSNSTEQEATQLGGVETYSKLRSSQGDEDGQNERGNSSDQVGEPESGELSNLTEQEVAQLGGVETHPTSRSKSPSGLKSTTAMAELGDEDDPEIIAQSRIDVESNKESTNASSAIPGEEDSPMTNLAFDKEPTAPFSHQAEDAESQSRLEEDREDQNMDGSEVMKPSSDLMDVDEDVVARMNVVLKKSLNLADDFESGDPHIGMESNEMPLDEGQSADLEAPVRRSPLPELRRSSRNAVAKNKPILENLRSPIRGKRKPVFKKTATHFQAGDFITEFNKS